MSRSWVRKKSGIPASRATASSLSLAMGSSLTLPLVITSGSPVSFKSRTCSGVYASITPRYLRPGATDRDTGELDLRRISTMGAWGDSRRRFSEALM